MKKLLDNLKSIIRNWKFKKEYFFLFLICLLFLITRLFKITEIPPSLYWDEASIGYNAYSVLLTGKDEWGEVLPLHFRAFGEFKLPIYIYSVAVAIKIFGFNDLSVRLPAVLFSFGSLILIYLITKIFTKNGVSALYSAFFFVISPWGVIITRVGYEVNAGVMFFLMALFFFLRSSKKPLYFLFSVVFHIFAIYSYNSFRIISPIFIICTSLIFIFRNIGKSKIILLYVVGSFILVLFSFIPIYRLYRYDFGNLRYRSVSLQGTLIDKSKKILVNYCSHFSSKFLFISGDLNPRSQVPNWGELYWISLPFLILGLIEYLYKRRNNGYILLTILLLSPIPASLTKESPHALRSFLMFPILAIIFGFGTNYLYGFKLKYKNLLLWGLFLFMFFSFEALGQDIYLNYNQKTSKDWQYGYKKIFKDYIKDDNQYEKIIISDRYAQPYIFTLYYLRYDPTSFRQQVIYNPVDNWGFSSVSGFGKFIFKKVEESNIGKNTLIFSSFEDKLKQNIKPNSEIKFLDSSTAFYIYEK